jgi:hypothetical protein
MTSQCSVQRAFRGFSARLFTKRLRARLTALAILAGRLWRGHATRNRVQEVLNNI